MYDRRDSALLDDVIEAARAVDDYVAGVIGLSEGAIGDDNTTRSWLQRRLGGRLQRGVVQRLGSQYGPEQLRKAGDAAAELVQAVDDLSFATTAPGREAAARVAELRVGEIAHTLVLAADGPGSSVVREVHDRLRRTISICTEARTMAVLAEMRRAREQG